MINYEREDVHLKIFIGNSLVVQWLGLRASTAGGMGSIPGQGTKMSRAARPIKKKKEKDIHGYFYNNKKHLNSLN